MLLTINITIGTDMFSLDYNVHSYFHEIVESLDSGGVHGGGLDVSNVGGFDEGVFNRLDVSYIHDLKEVLSNCSDGSSYHEVDTFNFVELGKSGERSGVKVHHMQGNEADLPQIGIRRVESMTVYRPVPIGKTEEMGKGLTSNASMKKYHKNRSIDAGGDKVPKEPIVVEIQSNRIDLLKVKFKDEDKEKEKEKENEKKQENPESNISSPVQQTHFRL